MAQSAKTATMHEMTALNVWHLWNSRSWPASLEEEDTFRDDLHAHGQRPTRRGTYKPEGQPRDAEDARRRARVHITAVLNALRCGLTVQRLLEVLPGTDPRDLHHAYVTLERLRQQSYDSWVRILEDPTQALSPTVAAQASQLLPVPLHRIITRVSGTNGAGVDTAVHAAASQIDAQVLVARELEAALARRAAPDQQAVELGARLHNPLSPALWGSAYYLPRRVTDLSPTRVADLLNERNVAA